MRVVPGKGTPYVSDIGRSLFVAGTVGPLDRGEAVPFVEPPGSPIGLEGPQLQGCWPEGSGDGEQLGADAGAGMSWVHIELIHESTVEDHEPDHSARGMGGYPEFPLGEHGVDEPRPDLVVVVTSGGMAGTAERRDRR